MSNSFQLPYQTTLISMVLVALEEIAAGSNSIGMLLLGPSGAGKTFTLDLIAALFSSTVVGYQRIVPCVRIAADAKASATSIACGILAQLGIPLQVSSKFTPKKLEVEVIEAICSCKVVLLILEELHNALLVNTPQLRGQLSRFVKNLWNLHRATTASGWAHPNVTRGDHRLVILASGTDELRTVFEKDDELRSRFSCRVVAPRLSFDPPESFKAFRGVLDAMVGRVGLHELISASDTEMAARTLIACEGHLRILESVLQRTATIVHRGAEALGAQELLALAFDEVGGGNSEASNPFRWTTAEIAARIKRARISQKLSDASTPGKSEP